MQNKISNKQFIGEHSKEYMEKKSNRHINAVETLNAMTEY